MELTARRLQPAEWPEAARLMARSLQESLTPMFPDSATERVVMLYKRFEALPTEGGIGNSLGG